MFDLIRKQECLIFGAGEQAKIAQKILQEIYEIEVKAFVVSDLSIHPDILEGTQVIGLEQLPNYGKDIQIYIATSLQYVDEIEKQFINHGYCKVDACAPDYDFDYDLRTSYFKDQYKKSGKQFLCLAGSQQEECSSAIQDDFQVYLARSHKDKVADYTKYFETYRYVIPVQAGAALTKLDLEEIKDDTGRQISSKNGDYCELSVLYWIWKNRSSDYMGLCHYRRWFEIDESKIAEIKEKDIDVVLPIPALQLPSNQEKWCQYHDEKEWNAMCQMIQLLYPEYKDTVEEYGRMHTHYKYNMLVAKKEIFNHYCQWIFSILFAIEAIYKKNHIIVEGRYLGYIAENLTSIYFIHNYRRYNIIHEKVLFVEQTGRKSQL